ncbi:NPHN protein, partial [Alcedo cyanopectus]|nr:NPHN protein [Ceyx cyanopectus]
PVSPATPEPPVIEGLESPQVRAGETLRLVCVVRGGNPPPSLHWDKSGRSLPGSWVSHGGVTRARVSVPVTPEDDGATLTCSLGGGGSASITLSVSYPPSEVRIAGSPALAENQSATLSCSSSPSNPPVRLRWWLGGQELEPDDTSTTQAPGGGWASVSNVTLRGQRSAHGTPLVCEASAPGIPPRTDSVLLSVSRQHWEGL